jgi:hypothetical protein
MLEKVKEINFEKFWKELQRVFKNFEYNLEKQNIQAESYYKENHSLLCAHALLSSQKNAVSINDY